MALCTVEGTTFPKKRREVQKNVENVQKCRMQKLKGKVVCVSAYM